ncbi:MAG TPA: MGMT family protein [Pyrinomonadaceae bacterium]|nr:MGMT family protein [Pyrinomonadaceae bacterium]
MPKPNDKLKHVAQYRERVYKIVRRIPRGKVMTYGQIAYMLGEGYTPRTVGFVMHGSDENNTPWHRVINSQGRVSTGRLVLPSDKQQRMLEREGVKFDKTGRCDLEVFIWQPARRTKEKTDASKGRGALYGRSKGKKS